MSDKQRLPLHRVIERSVLFSAALVCDTSDEGMRQTWKTANVLSYGMRGSQMKAPRLSVAPTSSRYGAINVTGCGYTHNRVS